MLTKELLEVRKHKPDISPRYREIEEYRDVAAEVVEAYRPGRTRGEIEEAVSALETHDTFKLVRGLSKLLERRATFEQEAAVPPATLREAAFERGYVTSEAERERVLEEVAADFDMPPHEADRMLWADRAANEVLREPPEIDPGELLRQYNLSLTQTLLFDAVELSFTVSDNYQEIFGRMSYLGLMYTVDPDLTVTVTGPAALFKHTRKYGTELAKLLPSIIKAEEWTVRAEVETEVSGETRLYEFEVTDEESHLFPERTAAESFDSEVERDFATRIDSLADGWTVTREPTILRANERVMIPDFGFERNGHELYLEVIGFWTPAYLAEKIEKVRAVETEVPLLLAVDRSLDCSEQDFEGADQVFFYDERIPVKPVLSRLEEIDERIIAEDLDALKGETVSVPDAPVDVTERAHELGVAPQAIKRYLEGRDGVVSDGTYLPPAVLEELRAEIDALENPVLSDVNPILDDYGVGQDVLGSIGYHVQYTSLDQDEATLTRE
ncbi:MAG: DUF790 family protein [Halodesulfurarchaeum sp.]